MASVTETVLVRITNEAVDVWRPVEARRLSPSVFKLSDDPMPDDEQWSFHPGATVVVERPAHLDVKGGMVAVALVLDLDEPSTRLVAEAA